MLQPPEDEDADIWPDFIAPDDDEDMAPPDDDDRPVDFVAPEDDEILTPVASLGL